MIRTPFTELLGIDHPVVSAPMAGVAGAALAKAVSAAGGFGFIGGGYGDPDWLEAELAMLDPATIGVGFITWRLAEQPALLDRVLEHRPKAIFLSFGDVQAFAPRIKASDAVLFAQTQSLADARAAAACGADVIVAQGTEAGGHGASRATLPLVPAVVDAVAPVPVLAAGGIADGRGLAAALMLGAAGVVMGTRFYCTRESLAHERAKSRAIEADGDTTVRGSVFDVLRGYDWPRPYTLRTLANRTTARFSDELDGLRAEPMAERARFEQAIRDTDYDVAAVIVGEAIDLVTDIPSAADVVAETVKDAAASIKHTAESAVTD